MRETVDQGGEGVLSGGVEECFGVQAPARPVPPAAAPSACGPGRERGPCSGGEQLRREAGERFAVGNDNAVITAELRV
ncbi:hypothetical protein ACEZCY_33685 [Streptacidiphilus sp. N1-12]|uniref:Uncharacterized protein n=2 Tax=Streptacidiphilus alkalitolerans TaxID=3342712 RepID=A0ABV6WRC6_9ACTN